jgi:ATP-dependent DNA helicase RecQ
MNSAEEAAFWRDRLHGGGAADSVGKSVAGRSVLLVVDATSSIWPITVASAVLRRAGASVVLPLLLHRRP